jgi:hypothetical protein
MIRPEHKLWVYLRDGMGNRWLPQRHEDKHSEGIPYLYYCIKRCGWIELKYVVMPKDPNIIIKIPHWTPAQRNWLVSRGPFIDLCFVLIQIGDSYLLIGWKKCNLLGESSYEELADAAMARWHGRIIWDDFKKLIS